MAAQSVNPVAWSDETYHFNIGIIISIIKLVLLQKKRKKQEWNSTTMLFAPPFIMQKETNVFSHVS